MSIINKLATSLKRRDEEPNIALAVQVVAKKDVNAVKELFELLAARNKDIQHDCIKVIYEIAERDPRLISGYLKELLALLTSRNNRLQWGAMHAIDAVSKEIPKQVYAALPQIMAAADNGSVITRDHAVAILINLCSIKQYTDDAFSLLNEQIKNSPVNQVPMYAEKSLPVIPEKNKKVFANTLTSRLKDFEKETQRKRVQVVLKKLIG